jgi:hypothetical protein
MLESERIAIAAHLHVQLRRLTGRVTDTEWMARNLEYADAMVRFAREASRDKGAAELAELAQRLEAAMQPLRPAPKTVKAASPKAPEPAAEGSEARYVGRLRGG